MIETNLPTLKLFFYGIFGLLRISHYWILQNQLTKHLMRRLVKYIGVQL